MPHLFANPSRPPSNLELLFTTPGLPTKLQVLLTGCSFFDDALCHGDLPLALPARPAFPASACSSNHDCSAGYGGATIDPSALRSAEPMWHALTAQASTAEHLRELRRQTLEGGASFLAMCNVGVGRLV